MPYRSRVRTCLKALIEHGRDRYGPEETPLFVSILDAARLECPEDPLPLDEVWRVQRRGRRNPAGANLNGDHGLLRSLTWLAERDGDERFARAAEEHACHVFDHHVDERGFPWWGWHRHIDVFRDRRDGHDGNPHELHATEEVLWPYYRSLRPAVIERAVEACWQWHVVDKDTGEVNRHGDGLRGCDFSMSSGAFILAFAEAGRHGDRDRWQERARLLARYYWDRREPATGLAPERPNAGARRFDGGCTPTSVPGLHGFACLRAGELLDDPQLTDYGLGHVLAFHEHAWDEAAQAYAGALALDGMPLPEREEEVREASGDLSGDNGADYHLFEPRGRADLWQPYAAGYEHPLACAQACVYAWQRSGDRRFATHARRWAEWIWRSFPPRACTRRHSFYQTYARDYAPHGTHARNYARACALFLHLHVLDGRDEDRQRACAVADEALRALGRSDVLLGHHAKPYYEAMDGVGDLLYVLLALDAVLEGELRAEGTRVGAWNVRFPLW